MGGEALEEQVEVVAGELPLEGLGAGLLAGLDGEQARFDLLQVDQVMTTQPYTSARRMFWAVDNGSSHRGQRSVDRLRDAKVGVAWGDPRQVGPAADGVLGKPPPNGRAQDLSDQPAGDRLGADIGHPQLLGARSWITACRGRGMARRRGQMALRLVPDLAADGLP